MSLCLHVPNIDPMDESQVRVQLRLICECLFLHQGLVARGCLATGRTGLWDMFNSSMAELQFNQVSDLIGTVKLSSASLGACCRGKRVKLEVKEPQRSNTTVGIKRSLELALLDQLIERKPLRFPARTVALGRAGFDRWRCAIPPCKTHAGMIGCPCACGRKPRSAKTDR